jgi:hypothetical protein
MAFDIGLCQSYSPAQTLSKNGLSAERQGPNQRIAAIFRLPCYDLVGSAPLSEQRQGGPQPAIM